MYNYLRKQRIEEAPLSGEASPSPSSSNSTPKKKKLTKIMDESKLSKETQEAMALEKQRQERKIPLKNTKFTYTYFRN